MFCTVQALKFHSYTTLAILYSKVGLCALYKLFILRANKASLWFHTLGFWVGCNQTLGKGLCIQLIAAYRNTKWHRVNKCHMSSELDTNLDLWLPREGCENNALRTRRPYWAMQYSANSRLLLCHSLRRYPELLWSQKLKNMKEATPNMGNAFFGEHSDLSNLEENNICLRRRVYTHPGFHSKHTDKLLHNFSTSMEHLPLVSAGLEKLLPTN